MSQATTDKLMRDLDVVVEDAQELADANSASQTERIASAKASAQESMRQIADNLRAARRKVRAARDAVQDANRYVHDNPWTSLGIAAGAGILVGLLMSRRPRNDYRLDR